MLGGTGLEKDLEGDRGNVHDIKMSVAWLLISTNLTLCLEKQRRFSGQIMSGELTDLGPLYRHIGSTCRTLGNELSPLPASVPTVPTRSAVRYFHGSFV